MPAGRERALKGKLLLIGDKGVPRVLETGDPVMVRFKGDDALAYYPGCATEILENRQWHIMYDDGGEEDLFVRQPGKIVAVLYLLCPILCTLMVRMLRCQWSHAQPRRARSLRRARSRWCTQDSAFFTSPLTHPAALLGFK
jgi:hypothetical protein